MPTMFRAAHARSIAFPSPFGPSIGLGFPCWPGTGREQARDCLQLWVVAVARRGLLSGSGPLAADR